MLKFMALLWALWRYRTKRALFKYMRTKVFKPTSPAYLTFIRAYEEIERDFRDVKRESGKTYMTHIHAVAVVVIVHLKSRDLNEILAALFHDAIEHFPEKWTYLLISRDYNVVLARWVLHLTKISVAYFTSEFDRDFAYHGSFDRAEHEVARVKIADRTHNNLTLYHCPLEKQLRKITETTDFYIDWAKDRNIMYHELSIATKIANIRAFFSSA